MAKFGGGYYDPVELFIDSGDHPFDKGVRIQVTWKELERLKVLLSDERWEDVDG